MSQKKGFNRRQFLRNSAIGLVGTGVLSQGKWLSAQEADEREEKVTPKIRAYRTLGRTGFKASDISTGGPMEPAILNALLDSGVNYIDTAEGYGNG